MDLWNSSLSSSSELFPEDTVEKAIVKAYHVLHDQAICTAETIEKPSKKPQKHLQFSVS